MRQAESPKQLLFEAFQSLPLSQRGAGSVALDEFIDALLPVVALTPTPFRDRIIDFQVGNISITLGVGNTVARFLLDAVPAGEIHRYMNLTGRLTIGVDCTVQVSVITNSAELRYAQRTLLQNEHTDLLSASDVDAAGSLTAARQAPAGSGYIDVFPGGQLRVDFGSVANLDVVVFRALRLRMHGPRETATDLSPFISPSVS